MDLLFDAQTPEEIKYTNKIRLQALKDANTKLLVAIKNNSDCIVDWFLIKRMESNEKRMKLYN